MSAQLAELEPRLLWAVSQGAISSAEAWELQDLVLVTPGNQVLAPASMQDLLGRIWLLEQPPGNRLPA